MSRDRELIQALGFIDPEVFGGILEFNPKSFLFLHDLPFQQVKAFVRAVAKAESQGICRFRGSVSLLIPAYVACCRRPVEESAAIADWIVLNHENPYTPFNFRQTRAYWESARRNSSSPAETHRRVKECERLSEIARRHRAVKHAVTEGINRLHLGEAPVLEQIRQSMINEMERRIFE